MDFKGQIDLVPTPEEYVNVLPNKAFCIIKTGQIQYNNGTQKQILEQLTLHLDVLQAMMVILLTDVKGIIFKGQRSEINIGDIDFSREGAYVTLEPNNRKGPGIEHRFTAPHDEMTSIVKLVA